MIPATHASANPISSERGSSLCFKRTGCRRGAGCNMFSRVRDFVEDTGSDEIVGESPSITSNGKLVNGATVGSERMRVSNTA